MPLTAIKTSNLDTTNSLFFRNRIINGACIIDQRNAGASVTINNTGAFQYVVDRFYGYGSVASKFSLQQNAGSVTPPVGFTNYLGATSLSAYSSAAGDFIAMGQEIEGYNIADLGWGTANAKTVTFSFWVRSSLTGTFGGAFVNNAQNRSYPFSYTISSANTWEQKSITVAGDTSGTWTTTNGVGIRVRFNIGCGSNFAGTAGSWTAGNLASATGATSVVGTNGATFYITGVQLEVGSSATDFERRPYGQELALCQRYFYNGSVIPIGAAVTRRDGGNIAILPVKYPTTMRATPTGGATGTWQYYSDTSTWTNVAGGTQMATAGDINYGTLDFGVGTNANPTLGGAWYVRLNGGTYSFSAEL